MSEVWTRTPQGPQGLADKFKLWSEFAAVRAALVCLRNQNNCRRVVPLGCSHATDLARTDGTVLARANFVFVCAEI
jgi:hypothetical protein